MEVTNDLMYYNQNQALLSFTDKSTSIDILEKLKLVKSNMNLVINLATWYSTDTEKPFSQMLKVGISSVIKSAKTFCGNHNEFGAYLEKEISDAMQKYSRL
jgi:DNA-directed RNA polymerase specialized sigma subunit